MTSLPEDCPCPAVVELKKMVDDHEKRLVPLETVHSQINDITEALEKLAKLIKFWGPSLISAAIAAGYVNGKLGAFLHSLING